MIEMKFLNTIKDGYSFLGIACANDAIMFGFVFFAISIEW